MASADPINTIDPIINTLDPFTLPNFSSIKWKYACAFDVHMWYHDIASYTYGTEWFSLTHQDAQALQQHYKHLILEWPPPSSEDASLIQALKSKIQQCIEQHNWANGVFVRLTSRSPKDVGFDLAFAEIDNNQKRWTQTIQSLLEKDRNISSLSPSNESESESTTQTKDSSNNHEQQQQQQQDNDINNCTPEEAVEYNTKLRALMQLTTHLLCAHTPDQAMTYLTSSERIYSDLLRCADTDPAVWKWDVRLIVREWADVDPEMEFRCFVANRKMVAITQYNNQLLYPFLCNVGFLRETVSCIVSTFEKVSDLIQYNLYVIDFAVHADLKSATIIELNPAGPMTGGSFFDWNLDRDLLTTYVPSRCDPPPVVSHDVLQIVHENVVVRVRKEADLGLKRYWEVYGSSWENQKRNKAKKESHASHAKQDNHAQEGEGGKKGKENEERGCLLS